jgi:hypothetical protein
MLPDGLVLAADADDTDEEAAEAGPGPCSDDATAGDNDDDDDAAVFAGYRRDVAEALVYLCFFLEGPCVTTLRQLLEQTLQTDAGHAAVEGALFCVAAGGADRLAKPGGAGGGLTCLFAGTDSPGVHRRRR